MADGMTCEEIERRYPGEWVVVRDFLRFAPGAEVEGLLGADFFAGLVLTIDDAASTVSLTEPQPTDRSESQAVTRRPAAEQAARR